MLPPPGPVVASAAPAPGAPVAPAANANGTYKGTGKTDSWCMTPMLNATVNGTAIEGQLSEVSNKPTSAVTGTVYPNGIISLEFQGSDDKYFTGNVDGTLKDDTLSVSFRSKAPSACRMEFNLKKG